MKKTLLLLLFILGCKYESKMVEGKMYADLEYKCYKIKNERCVCERHSLSENAVTFSEDCKNVDGIFPIH